MEAAAREYERSHGHSSHCVSIHSEEFKNEEILDLACQRVLAVGGYISVTVPAGSVVLAEIFRGFAMRDIQRYSTSISPRLKPKLYYELGMMYLRQADARSIKEKDG